MFMPPSRTLFEGGRAKQLAARFERHDVERHPASASRQKTWTPFTRTVKAPPVRSTSSDRKPVAPKSTAHPSPLDMRTGKQTSACAAMDRACAATNGGRRERSTCCPRTPPSLIQWEPRTVLHRRRDELLTSWTIHVALAVTTDSTIRSRFLRPLACPRTVARTLGLDPLTLAIRAHRSDGRLSLATIQGYVPSRGSLETI